MQGTHEGPHHLFEQVEVEKKDAPEDEAMDDRDIVSIWSNIILINNVYSPFQDQVWSIAALNLKLLRSMC